MTDGKQDLAATATALNSGAIHLLRAMGAIDRKSGLTPARLSALSVLVFAGPCTLGRLAAVEDVAGPTMTRIVDGLEALGLAVRAPHPDSARAVRIEPTAAGTELMHQARAQRVEALVHALEGLTPTDRKRLVAAAPLFDQLAGAIRAATDTSALKR